MAAPRETGLAQDAAGDAAHVTAVVRAMQPDDAVRVAALHEAALSPGFFVRLGPWFLRTYYRRRTRNSGDLMLVALVDGAVAGFAAGVVDSALHRRSQVRDVIHLAMPALIGMLRRPSVLVFFLRTRARRYARRLLGSARPAVSSDGMARIGHLTYLVVAPEVRGAGVGAALLDEFWQQARARGCSGLTLVTRLGPRGAEHFYRAHGWRSAGTHRTPDGEILRVMRLQPVDALPASRDPGPESAAVPVIDLRDPARAGRLTR